MAATPAENPVAATQPDPAPELEATPEPGIEPTPKAEPEAAPDLELEPLPEPQTPSDLQPDPALKLEPVSESADEAPGRINAEDISAVDAASEKAQDGLDPTLGGIPALTLDDSLDDARKNVIKPEVTAEKSGGDVAQKMAEELGKAKSLDDLDDEMAATFFGDEAFDAIAAAAIANPPGNGASGAGPSDDSETIGTDATPAASANAPLAAIAEPAAELDLQLEPEAATEPAAKAVAEPAPKAAKPSAATSNGAAAQTVGIDQQMGYTGKFNMSMTSRFRMVDKLTKDKAKPVYSAIARNNADATSPEPTPKPAPAPKSLEEQLNSANGAAPVAPAGAGKTAKPGSDKKSKAKKRGGLLGRFKR